MSLTPERALDPSAVNAKNYTTTWLDHVTGCSCCLTRTTGVSACYLAAKGCVSNTTLSDCCLKTPQAPSPKVALRPTLTSMTAILSMLQLSHVSIMQTTCLHLLCCCKCSHGALESAKARCCHYCLHIIRCAPLSWADSFNVLSAFKVPMHPSSVHIASASRRPHVIYFAGDPFTKGWLRPQVCANIFDPATDWDGSNQNSLYTLDVVSNKRRLLAAGSSSIPSEDRV